MMTSTLATALLFGIKTDTDSLTRGVSPADVNAYAFLQERAELTQVRRFERPSYPVETARAYGGALASMVCERDLCAVFLGELAEDLRERGGGQVALEHVPASSPSPG